MRSDAFLDGIVARLRSVIARARAATQGITPEAFNRQPKRGVWSPAQVFEHMMMANKRYLASTRKAVESAPKSSDLHEAKHSWWGKIVIKASGPQGKAPAPRMLHPKPGPYGLELVDRWVAEHEEIIALAERARSLDLNCTMRNPFMPVFKQTLADSFETLVSHAERHVGQIEERVR